MIAIIDYGVGNLFSLCSSFKSLGADVTVTGDADVIRKADKLVLPGVGAFSDAAEKLRSLSLDRTVIGEAQKGKPLLGICLGMQMLFEKSYEYGEYDGLGLIKGEVIGMKGTIPENLKIPHIGWNSLLIKKENPLFKYIKDRDCVYFVHSFYAHNCNESLIATAEYGKEITAAVARDNIFGCQFHPEKSGEVGIKILKAFCEFGE